MEKWKLPLVRFILILSITYLSVVAIAKLTNYFVHDGDIKNLVAWFEINEKLSGWAQFVGAGFAIFLAIAIPAWQRHGQQLDRRRDRADFEASLSEISYNLLVEVRDHLKYYLFQKDKIRSSINGSVLRDDLLQRIHSIEMKEIKPNRIRLLNTARYSLYEIEWISSSVDLQNSNLSDNEVILIKKLVNSVNDCVEKSYTDARVRFEAMLIIHHSLFIRNVLSIINFVRPSN